MSSNKLYGRARLLSAIVTLAAAAMVAQAAASEAARLERFTHSDADYIALSLRPTGVVAEAGPRQVVILFDTSAGQAGAYREKALEVLEGLLASLNEADRVQLMAVDTRTVSLTNGFVSGKSPELTQALARLKARVPLGATDLDAALTSVIAAVGEGETPTAVVYMGKGTSRANILTPDRVAELTGQLAAKRVSVNSYVVGLNPDRLLLGVLASKTGGTVLMETAGVEAAAETQALASAVPRSEERRVGKECRSRWSPYH